MCTSFPSLPVVLVKVNIGNFKRMEALMKKHKNLYFETSYFSRYCGIEHICKTAKAERVIFGSGFPAIEPGCAVTALELAEIDTKEKELIAGKNLSQILKGAKL